MIDPSPLSPSLRLAIDGAALAANWRALDRLSGGVAGAPRAGAAVKADGYGLGARRVVPVLRDAGAQDFFVAHWAEAAALLDLVPPAQIAVLHGPLTAQDVDWARATGVRPVISSLRQAALWRAGGGGGRCDLMVDTGINRLGLPMADLGHGDIVALKIDVLMSHLASADENVAQNAQALARWQDIRRAVPHARASLANSAGIALGAAWHGDLTRPGLALYGGVPRAELAGTIAAVVRPQAALIQTRWLAAGDGVGYNATFVAGAAMRVGVVSMGYADGYLRGWAGHGAMRAIGGGAALPVIGRVSMDMVVIDLTAAPDLTEGDWVEAEYDLPRSAVATGLSQYELLTLLGRRFGR